MLLFCAGSAVVNILVLNGMDSIFFCTLNHFGFTVIVYVESKFELI